MTTKHAMRRPVTSVPLRSNSCCRIVLFTLPLYPGPSAVEDAVVDYSAIQEEERLLMEAEEAYERERSVLSCS